MYCKRCHNQPGPRDNPKALSWALLVVWLMVATGALHAGHILSHHGGHLPGAAPASPVTDHVPGAGHSDSSHPHTPEDSTPDRGKPCKLCQLVRSLNTHALTFHAEPILSVGLFCKLAFTTQVKPAGDAPLPFSARGPPAA